jgi:hypothetical protein
LVDGSDDGTNRKENRMKKQTMEANLLRLMRRRYVTPLDALQAVGCLSLSQRAGEFAREGYRVAKRWVDLPGGKRVMSYRVEGGRA